MNNFFDDSHVTDVGLKGSAGRSVGFFDSVAQGFQQQFRVDSARALDEEIENRWVENLRRLERSGGGRFEQEVDPLNYRRFAQFTQGQPVDALPRRPIGEGYGARFTEERITPEEQLQNLLKVNEAIKKLGNPEVKTFEQILEEVAQMQAETEQTTGEMSERGGVGGAIGQLIGAIGGSFTSRDPLNIVTAPWGAGRTVAMRIASEMGIAAAVTTTTELGDVAPNRALAGLPERSPLMSIGAATLGAGAIRGGIEGLGYGVRRLRARAEPEIDFDLRDTQLEQMFVDRSQSPSARAGASILDDVKFVERNNPYGEGHLANVRFLAELQNVQKAMNGEPMTAVARTLPPMPFEYIEREGNFALVKEQKPLLYARMEATQVNVRELTDLINQQTDLLSRFDDSVRGMRPAFQGADGKVYYSSYGTTHADVEFDVPYETLTDGFINSEGRFLTREEALTEVQAREGDIPIDGQPISGRLEADSYNRRKLSEEFNLRSFRIDRRSATREYIKAYRAVEAEANAIRAREQAFASAQQKQAVALVAPEGVPFTGPLLRYDSVESLVDRINTFNDTLDEREAARFVRETVGEGEDAIELEVWERDGGIDIGLKDPVDPNFRFVTDEGEFTVAEAMRDLQEDTDLIEAIKVCAI